jgi:hypothetical protein
MSLWLSVITMKIKFSRTFHKIGGFPGHATDPILNIPEKNCRTFKQYHEIFIFLKIVGKNQDSRTCDDTVTTRDSKKVTLI